MPGAVRSAHGEARFPFFGCVAAYRKRVTIYTNATWLQPLAVPVDATARRLHIIALSMYALKVPVGEAEELAQLADSTALHRLQGRVKGGAALSLASIHIRLVRFRTFENPRFEVGGKDLARSAEYPVGLGVAALALRSSL